MATPASIRRAAFGPDQPPEGLPAVELRDPAHRVSPRAIHWWRVSSLIADAFLLVPLIFLYAVWPGLPSRTPAWLEAITPWALVLLVALSVVHLTLMPRIRYRIHRWEVTPAAVHTRSGWIGTQTRIAPLNRVQTVDSQQSALMRLFRLASLTVTTASAAGPISIVGLDVDEAGHLVAQLTEVTAAADGDAT